MMHSSDKKFEDWFKIHYPGIFLIFIAFFVFFPIAAPILQEIGMTSLAKSLYEIFSLFCHQLPYRSWFLFGKQAFYPIGTANIGDTLSFTTFSQISINDYSALSRFLGNETMGYKMAICQRDFAMYSSFLFFGLIFIGLNRKLKPLPFWIWVFFGLFPFAIDGVIQLLSKLNLTILSNLAYESSPLMRTITGAGFGFLSGWVILPSFENMFNKQV